MSYGVGTGVNEKKHILKVRKKNLSVVIKNGKKNWGEPSIYSVSLSLSSRSATFRCITTLVPAFF